MSPVLSIKGRGSRLVPVRRISPRADERGVPSSSVPGLVRGALVFVVRVELEVPAGQVAVPELQL